MRCQVFETIIRKLCERISRRLNARFIPESGDLYLARFFVFPRKPHGGEDVGDSGPFGIYLHHFARSDADHELHNHPWEWGLSFVLTGGYQEERRGTDDAIAHKLVKPFRFNFLRANTYHRVDLSDPANGAWTLFFRGPRTQGWGFWCRYSGTFTRWQEFVTRKSKRSQAAS